MRICYRGVRVSKDIVGFQFSKKLLIEKDLLFKCDTNKGFIQRLVAHFMPRLRQSSGIGELIIEWEKMINEDEDLRKRAYQELGDAFIKIKKVLKAAELEEKPRRVFFEKNPSVPAYQDIVNDICAEGSVLSCEEPPYARVYYKLRLLYVNHVSRSWEIEFAPSALKLIEKDKIFNFLAMADCDPAYLWIQCVLIERAWNVEEKLGSIAWKQIEADECKMWLEADSAFREALKNWRAGVLYHSDDPSYGNSTFDRENMKALVERILKEIELKMNDCMQEVVLKEKKHGHMINREHDQEILTPYVLDSWRKFIEENQNIVHLSPKKIAKDVIDSLPSHLKGSLHVKGDRLDSRIKSLAKTLDPRMFVNGKYIGWRPDWNQF
jgi:hypothetical protein